jgi:hypothetical protein
MVKPELPPNGANITRAQQAELHRDFDTNSVSLTKKHLKQNAGLDCSGIPNN